MDIETITKNYQKLISIGSITEIISEDFCAMLLRGSLASICQNALVIYKKSDGSHGLICPFEYSKEENVNFINTICWEMRRKVPEINEDCKQWCIEKYGELIDKNFNNELKEFYICPYGFKKYVRPIILNGKTLAVFLAGQEIPDDNGQKDDLYEILRTLNSAHMIFEDLDETFLSEEIKQARLKELNIEPSFCYDNFHKSLEGLLNKLSVSKRYEAYRFYLHASAEFLVKQDMSDKRKWLEVLENILISFSRIVGLDSFKVYTRNKRVFQNIVPITDEKSLCQVPVKEVLEFYNVENNNNVLLELKDEHDKIKKAFQISDDKSYHVYLCKSGDRDNYNMYTLILITGCIESKYAKFITDFCKVITRILTIASLVFDIEEHRIYSENKITEITHDMRTPLQHLLYDMVLAMRELGGIDEYVHLKDNLEISIARVKWIHRLSLKINEVSSEKKKNIEISSMVSKLIKEHKNNAKEKECLIELQNNLPNKLGYLKVFESNFYRALMNILDNAIKYSFSGFYSSDGELRQYEIIVKISLKGDMLEILFSNYGVGIPPKSIEDVKVKGVRINKVDDPDREKKRKGYGLGLPIATRIIEEEHSGELIIQSQPSQQNRKQNDDYLRYVTTVSVMMPVAKIK